MNKIVLITGASSGFGQACAERFAAAGGYDLILTGRRKERLDALKQRLTNARPPSRPVPPFRLPLKYSRLTSGTRQASNAAIGSLPSMAKDRSADQQCRPGTGKGLLFDRADMEDWKP